MEKKSLIIPVLFVFLLNFVSAQFYEGFTDFLYNIDPNAMTLGVLFIVLFAILFFSLSRIFKDKYGYPNKTIATIVALALSVLCVYWVNRTGFDMTGLFYSIGFSEEILYIIAPLIVLVGLIFIFTRFKEKRFGKTLLILGGLLLVLSFTDLIYETEFLTIISIIMVVVGLWLTLRKPRGPRGPRPRRGPKPWRDPKPWREPKPRRGPRGPEGLIGPTGPEGVQGPTGRTGRRFGVTPRQPKPKGREFGLEKMRQVKERLKQERRAEKEEQKRLQITSKIIPPSRQLVSPEQMDKLEKERGQEQRGKTLEKRQRQYQKMVHHLQMLGGKKERELQKQEMMAAKGVVGAEQKVRTLRAELEEIARKMQKYSLS